MQLITVDGHTPSVDAAAWVAPGAVVAGRVTIGKDTGVWYTAVVRADTEAVTVGEGTSVQDGTVIHADPGFPCTLGDNVSIGHSVMLHGCTVDDETLIGIGAVILNGAKIGKNCVIGANAFIPEGKEIPDRSVVFGSPGKVVKEVEDKHIEMVKRIPGNYVRRWKVYKEQLREDGF